MASRARSPAARLPALYVCELAGAASSSAPRSKRTHGSEWGGRRGAGVAGGGVAATLETANISGERSEGNPLIVGISGMPSAAVVGNARLACGSVRRRSAPPLVEAVGRRVTQGGGVNVGEVCAAGAGRAS